MSASPGNGLAAKWLPEHDNALRRHLDVRLSFTQAAAKINAEFRTSYSRNAAIGRANRLGWQSSCPKTGGQRKRPTSPRKGEVTAAGIVERTQRRKDAHVRPVFACDETGLRIADVVPLNLTILETSDDTCKWPYGKEPPLTYCGHQPLEGLPYCASHTALATRPTERGWDQTASQRAAHRKAVAIKFAAIGREYGDEDAA